MSRAPLAQKKRGYNWHYLLWGLVRPEGQVSSTPREMHVYPHWMRTFMRNCREFGVRSISGRLVTLSKIPWNYSASIFKVTMEAVFTTLEHTARMVETTGENRDFKRAELDLKRERLKQAIAATLEESLCAGGQREGTECDYHRTLVDKMKTNDSIISFNYDCLIDETLRRHGSGKWNSRYGYGLNLGKGRSNLVGDADWAPSTPAPKKKTIGLYKLHGSLHFRVEGERVKLKTRPYTKQQGTLRFTIIPPESNKRYDEGVFKRIWYQAGQALHRARHLVVIGYSFPVTDSHATALFRISIKREGIQSLVLVNPDREARHRAREVLKRGLGSKTRVLVFDTLEQFIAVDRGLWG
jgi:hypothetical protein